MQSIDSDSLLDSSWISATSTYNYMMKDPLLDWLKYHHSTFTHTNKRYSKSVNLSRNNTSSTTNYNFTSYIMDQGVTFEKKVMKLITKKFTSSRVLEIHGELAPRDPKKARETVQAMKNGVPIIHSGVLHDQSRNTFGIPDLLIRSDWIKFLVHESPYLLPEIENIPSPTLNRPWHYRIIDIKFTCLLLRADSSHLLNSSSFPAYKSQLLIYNWALENIQGYLPNEVYILGRRWKSTSKGETFINNTCFDKFGIIDYTGLDIKFVSQTETALKWLRDVRSDEASTWNITKYPLSRWELYPNMCNTHDHPWHDVKQKLASENNELTNLWMVGPKHRDLALQAGISKWSDPRCNTDSLGIKGEKITNILRNILHVNRSTTLKIIPDIILNNIGGWQQFSSIEFFVDFETCNGAVSDIKHLPLAITDTIIFMIGVGYINPSTQKWIVKDFTVNRLTSNDEATICENFSKYILQVSDSFGVKHPKCFHWSHAEDSMWNDALLRHSPISSRWNSSLWHWVDLLPVFKDEPIVIHGCMSFGLKDVASAMKNHGFIHSVWDKSSSCVDGQGAMIAAYQANKSAILNNLSMKSIPIINDVIKYNRVDVRVLYEIVTYLRQTHLCKLPTKKRKLSQDSIDTNLPLSKKLKPIPPISKKRKLSQDSTDPPLSKKLKPTPTISENLELSQDSFDIVVISDDLSHDLSHYKRLKRKRDIDGYQPQILDHMQNLDNSVKIVLDKSDTKISKK